jgi:lipopolysaccharide/colanic/teichoic acid biosynthesis glycosyltransferase
LTGLWQVDGKNRTTFEEMIHSDVRYVETKSPMLDLAILLRTVPAILVQAWDTVTDKPARASAKNDRDRATLDALF